jgi:hypothetical protein
MTIFPSSLSRVIRLGVDSMFALASVSRKRARTPRLPAFATPTVKPAPALPDTAPLIICWPLAAAKVGPRKESSRRRRSTGEALPLKAQLRCPVGRYLDDQGLDEYLRAPAIKRVDYSAQVVEYRLRRDDYQEFVVASA